MSDDSVRRYDLYDPGEYGPSADMEESKDGEYVLWTDYERLRARVEELERGRITHDQIDAVWARRAKYLKDAEVFQFVTLGAKGIEEALKEFNIHACEECGGSGRIKKNRL